MPFRIKKQTSFPPCKKPWNVPLPEEQGKNKEKPVRKETERDRQEREHCLVCSLPDCDPTDPGCAIRPKDRRGGHGRIEPPEDFLKWGWGPKTSREWAKECGVSESTIYSWRRKYNLWRR